MRLPIIDLLDRGWGRTPFKKLFFFFYFIYSLKYIYMAYYGLNILLHSTTTLFFVYRWPG
jgi:hypothetical protein